MKLKVTTLAAMALLTASGYSQTANVYNFIEPVYMSDGTTTLRTNAEYYLGTFGNLNDAAIVSLFSGDRYADYGSLFSNFSVLGSIRNTSNGDFGFSFAPEAGDFSVPFNGNKEPGFFHNKAMQLVILGPVNGAIPGAGDLMEVGIYEAYNFNTSLAVKFETNDGFDINDFAMAGLDTLAADTFKIGARAIVGTGGTAGSVFALSSNGVAIPEPASGSLFLLGSAALLALRRLKKNV